MAGFGDAKRHSKARFSFWARVIVLFLGADALVEGGGKPHALQVGAGFSDSQRVGKVNMPKNWGGEFIRHEL